MPPACCRQTVEPVLLGVESHRGLLLSGWTLPHNLRSRMLRRGLNEYQGHAADALKNAVDGERYANEVKNRNP